MEDRSVQTGHQDTKADCLSEPKEQLNVPLDSLQNTTLPVSQTQKSSDNNSPEQTLNAEEGCRKNGGDQNTEECSPTKQPKPGLKRNVGSVLKVLRNIPADNGWPALLEILEKRKDDDLIVQGIRWELADIIAFSNSSAKKKAARVKRESEMIHDLPPVVKTDPVSSVYPNAHFNEDTQCWQAIERTKNGNENYVGRYDTDLQAHLASKDTNPTTRKRKRPKKSSFLELADLCERMPKSSELTKPKTKRKKQWRRSKFKGVTWDGRTQRWLCRVKWGNGLKYVGYFPTEMEAAKAHDVQARNLYADDLSAIKLNFGENGIHNEAIQTVANPEDSEDEAFETKRKKKPNKNKSKKKVKVKSKKKLSYSKRQRKQKKKQQQKKSKKKRRGCKRAKKKLKKKVIT
jgi:hypothetical protein